MLFQFVQLDYYIYAAARNYHLHLNYNYNNSFSSERLRVTNSYLGGRLLQSDTGPVKYDTKDKPSSISFNESGQGDETKDDRDVKDTRVRAHRASIEKVLHIETPTCLVAASLRPARPKNAQC